MSCISDNLQADLDLSSNMLLSCLETGCSLPLIGLGSSEALLCAAGFHWDVATMLKRLDAEFYIEYEAEDYSIDIALVQERIAVEVTIPGWHSVYKTGVEQRAELITSSMSEACFVAHVPVSWCLPGQKCYS